MIALLAINRTTDADGWPRLLGTIGVGLAWLGAGLYLTERRP